MTDPITVGGCMGAACGKKGMLFSLPFIGVGIGMVSERIQTAKKDGSIVDLTGKFAVNAVVLTAVLTGVWYLAQIDAKNESRILTLKAELVGPIHEATSAISNHDTNSYVREASMLAKIDEVDDHSAARLAESKSWAAQLIQPLREDLIALKSEVTVLMNAKNEGGRFTKKDGDTLRQLVNMSIEDIKNNHNEFNDLRFELQDVDHRLQSLEEPGSDTRRTNGWEK